MIKLQKIVSAMIMAMMLVVGLATLVTPAGVVKADVSSTPITPAALFGDANQQREVENATGLGTADVRTTIARIIRVAMGLLGIVAVVIVLIGGFTWMTAGGNEEKVGEAKKWIFAGVIGLAIILAAYALSKFAIEALVKATTTNVESNPLGG